MSNNDPIPVKMLRRVLIVGEPGAGKSSLLLRYADDTFSNLYLTTIGVDFRIKDLHAGDTPVKLQIWDTAGAERFQSIVASYYRTTHIFFIVYDCTDIDSFEKVEFYYDKIYKLHFQNKVCYLIATKCELSGKKVVSSTTGALKAAQYDMGFFEVSCLTGQGVDQAFLEATQASISEEDITFYQNNNKPVPPPKTTKQKLVEEFESLEKGTDTLEEIINDPKFSDKLIKIGVNIRVAENQDQLSGGQVSLTYEKRDSLELIKETGVMIQFEMKNHSDILNYENFFSDCFDPFKDFINYSIKSDISTLTGNQILNLYLDLSKSSSMNRVGNMLKFLLNLGKIPTPLEFFKLKLSDKFSPDNFLKQTGEDENIKFSGKIYAEFTRSVLQAIISELRLEKTFVNYLCCGMSKFNFDFDFDDLVEYLEKYAVPFLFGDEAQESNTKFSLAEIQKRFVPFILRFLSGGEKETNLSPIISEIYQKIFDLFGNDSVGEISEIKFYFGNDSVLKFTSTDFSILSLLPRPQDLPGLVEQARMNPGFGELLKLLVED